MTPNNPLVDRLGTLSGLHPVPRGELEWLAEQGHIEAYEAGAVLAPKGQRVEQLWIILSGHIAVEVDRGAGPRRVTDWRAGDVSGMLPYSRMKGPPGDNFAVTRTEILAIHERQFPEMVHRCPVFTAQTVHSMLDRARSFNTSDLQDEKMISLGKLAAGLAHELNNPASATVRGAKQLRTALTGVESAARGLGDARLSAEQFAAIEDARATCLARPVDAILSPLQQADREDEIAEWLRQRGLDAGRAAGLAEAGLAVDTLGRLARAVPNEVLPAVLDWIITTCTTHALAGDIEQAATRIHELVAAVKRFTYMDSLAGSEAVVVEDGLRDTVRIMAGKAKAKGATITLDIEPDLPLVTATGSELNQVWSNLLDNALDAIPEGGRIDVIARAERERVVVRVIDNGPGVPPEIMPHIFDPFFTTKPPGQGTGLGLDITRRLLRQCGGTIAVDSRPGQTEFRVSLGRS